MEIRYAVTRSSLGPVLVAATQRGACAIEFGDNPDQLIELLRVRFPQARVRTQDPTFDAHVQRVLTLIEAPRRGLVLPLDIRGTAFQQRVWKALQGIPPGTRATYTEIAKRVGRPAAVRAVGQACAANTLAVAIPCHRVVPSDGSLGSYRWGIDRKRKLLTREAKSGTRGPGKV